MEEARTLRDSNRKQGQQTFHVGRARCSVLARKVRDTYSASGLNGSECYLRLRS
jgi:hypothetical protein